VGRSAFLPVSLSATGAECRLRIALLLPGIIFRRFRLFKIRCTFVLSTGQRTTQEEHMSEGNPQVIVLMGSKSDWDIMQHTSETLKQFGIRHECRALSAHRTPAAVVELVSNAEGNGTDVIIAAAGGAAHLAGVVAAHTLLPVLGVPMASALNGLDSLLSTVQMPAGIPVGTLAIGKAGATNAALLAVAILARKSPELREKLKAFREEQTEKVLSTTLP
jgi:5-(carboxyamino)imidazole ribonucleotide mutase